MLGGKPPKTSYVPFPTAYVQTTFYKNGLILGGGPVGTLTLPNGSFKINAKRNATRVFMIVWLGLPV